jgi:Outer membrane protein and related peptidoglycan-associated (lipo)proteins
MPRCIARQAANAAAAVLVLLSFSAGAAAAQGSAAAPADRLVLVERWDFSRYRDGKYLGHAYREARGSLARNGEALYSGEAFVLEETLRDMRLSSRQVDRSGQVSVSLTRGGGIAVDLGGGLKSDQGFPSLRGLPAFPRDASTGALVPIDSLKVGDAWAAPGERALDFADTGKVVTIPFLAEYRFMGAVEYAGRPALLLKAKFATRWKAGRSIFANVSSASGTHDLDIYVDPEELRPLFVRDRFDESFALAGGAVGAAASSAALSGGTERRAGFCLCFFEGGESLDRKAGGEAIVAAVAGGSPSSGGSASAAPAGAPSSGGAGGQAPVEDALPPGAGPGQLIAGEGPALDETLGEINKSGALAASGLELDSAPEGLVLRVKDLRFVADSDELLPSEKPRLDAVAAALKALPDRSFLVAGHSASVGKEAGELELSLRRAKRVADELASRGIDSGRLLYRGFGSSRPIAPNDSEAGRAKNRRVEITILD